MMVSVLLDVAVFDSASPCAALLRFLLSSIIILPFLIPTVILYHLALFSHAHKKSESRRTGKSQITAVLHPKYRAIDIVWKKHTLVASIIAQNILFVNIK
jgi:quinol-cytochrome oxidoreductase complex cytochrome b subunit